MRVKGIHVDRKYKITGKFIPSSDTFICTKFIFNQQEYVRTYKFLILK